MADLLLAVFMVVAVNLANCTPLPEGFILDVNVDCGTNVAANNPVITVTSDMSLDVQIFCANTVKHLNTTESAKLKINGSFSAPSSDCIFNRRNNSNVFTIDAAVAYGISGSTIQQSPQFYTLTCTFDQNGNETTTAVKVTRGYIPPVELRVDAGDLTTSTITLDVKNVRDQVITTPIIRGCKIYISATTDGTNSEAGLRPTACDAINPTTNKTIPILRAGCGTGLVLRQYSGFTTNGMTTNSPYFEAVQVEDDAKMAFECVFTLCTTNCDGNSCQSASRKKRTTGVVEKSIIATSNSVELIPWQ